MPQLSSKTIINSFRYSFQQNKLVSEYLLPFLYSKIINFHIIILMWNYQNPFFPTYFPFFQPQLPQFHQPFSLPVQTQFPLAHKNSGIESVTMSEVRSPQPEENKPTA